MGREIKRVPIDFAQPLNEIWAGFLRPDKFDETPCRDCEGGGWSPRAKDLYDLWYGRVPFSPADTGSTPFTIDTPAVRAFAERNVANAPDYYGTGEWAIRTEARRLANLWNGAWGHHLSQEDVDALLADGRLREFTHTWTRETGWQPKEPAVHPTAAEVNEWSLTGFGHGSSNAYAAIRARCAREGVSELCATCNGVCSFEAYEGQRAEAEAWEREEPPTGDGWQLWETVSEGSPISPAFATAEELAEWMSSPAYAWGVNKHGQPSYGQALAFIKAGWAPTLAATPETGLVSGVEYIAATVDASA
jgi:hypothetical protein